MKQKLWEYIYATKDFTYKNLKNMMNNDKLAVVSGDNNDKSRNNDMRGL